MNVTGMAGKRLLKDPLFFSLTIGAILLYLAIGLVFGESGRKAQLLNRAYKELEESDAETIKKQYDQLFAEFITSKTVAEKEAANERMMGPGLAYNQRLYLDGYRKRMESRILQALTIAEMTGEKTYEGRKIALFLRLYQPVRTPAFVNTSSMEKQMILFHQSAVTWDYELLLLLYAACVSVLFLYEEKRRNILFMTGTTKTGKQGLAFRKALLLAGLFLSVCLILAGVELLFFICLKLPLAVSAQSLLTLEEMPFLLNVGGTILVLALLRFWAMLFVLTVVMFAASFCAGFLVPLLTSAGGLGLFYWCYLGWVFGTRGSVKPELLSGLRGFFPVCAFAGLEYLKRFETESICGFPVLTVVSVSIVSLIFFTGSLVLYKRSRIWMNGK